MKEFYKPIENFEHVTPLYKRNSVRSKPELRDTTNSVMDIACETNGEDMAWGSA